MMEARCRHWDWPTCPERLRQGDASVSCCLPPGHEGHHHNPHVLRTWDRTAAAVVPPFARNTEEALAGTMRERDAALAAAAALEARYVAGIRHALRVVHALHSTLPDGETVPRASADAMALAFEGALLAMLRGEG